MSKWVAWFTTFHGQCWCPCSKASTTTTTTKQQSLARKPKAGIMQFFNQNTGSVYVYVLHVIHTAFSASFTTWEYTSWMQSLQNPVQFSSNIMILSADKSISMINKTAVNEGHRCPHQGRHRSYPLFIFGNESYREQMTGKGGSTAWRSVSDV